MDIVRLVEYVKEWELFEKIDFDQIVSDFDFSNFDLDNFVYINQITDLQNINKSKKTLFILDKLLPENLEEFFDMNNVTILDLNAGAFGYGHKLWISKIDIVDLINLWFNIFEPIDLFTFLSCFDKSGKNYVRVSDLDIPWNFVDSTEKDIVSLEKHWFSVWNMSIVCTGIFFTEVLRLWNLLVEKWLPVKIFVLNKLNLDDITEFDGENNLVFVLDCFNNIGYEKYIRNKFGERNMNFIYPKYKNLTTISDEYRLEELEFDVIWFANALWNNL